MLNYLLDERELDPEELDPDDRDDDPELLPIDEDDPLEELLPTEDEDEPLLLLEELLGLTLLSVVVDLELRSGVFGLTDLSGVVVVLPWDLDGVSLSVVFVPRRIVLLLSVLFVDLSDTLRDVVPLVFVPFSLRVEVARVLVPSVFREDDLEPVTMRPLLSLLILRDTVLFETLRSLDLLLARESYNPRFVERTEE